MKQGIKDAAIAVFKIFPTAKSVWVSPDEQAFLDKSRAMLHSSDSVEVKRDEVMEEETDADTAGVSEPALEGVKAVTGKVKTMTSAEELEELKKNDNRKTVQDAIVKRLAELTTATATQSSAAPKQGAEPGAEPATKNDQ